MSNHSNSSEKSIDINSSGSNCLPSMQGVCLLPENFSILKEEQPPPVDNRPFVCTICGNRFRQQCHLTQHIRIHTNDRPYHCSHCEKAFKQKSQLNQHERIHTGEKPYQCPLCAKAFPQAGQLYSHKKTHGINPRVTKDPQPGTNTPQRGRKRKTKNPDQVILSPPPVAYLIESLHQPSQYQNLSTQPKQKKGNRVNSSKYNLDPVPSHVKEEQNKSRIIDNVSDLHERRKLIPVTRDQYQHFLQNQQLYFQQQQHHYHNQLQQQQQQHQQIQKQQQQQQHLHPYHQHLEAKNIETNLPTSSTLTYNHLKNMKNFETIRNTNVTPQPAKMEDVPSHLKDLEQLIPSDQT